MSAEFCVPLISSEDVLIAIDAVFGGPVGGDGSRYFHANFPGDGLSGGIGDRDPLTEPGQPNQGVYCTPFDGL